MGVFLPCTLSIFGAILFLRLTWAVGQAGVIGAFLIFLLAGLTVTLTSLSIAAISTNGTMKGGGAYYMISRALGPEFGGAVGVVFFAANSVGITFYLIAFAGELDVLINGTKGALRFMCLICCCCFTAVRVHAPPRVCVHHTDAPDQWMIKLYASVALAVLLVISMVGAQVFTKLNLGIFVVLVVSIITSTFSFVIPHGEWKGFQRSVFSKNVDFAFTEDVTTHKQMDFFSVFVVCFPAMTGIMAGANMSGDLANPGKSIGPGTLAAIGVVRCAPPHSLSLRRFTLVRAPPSLRRPFVAGHGRVPDAGDCVCRLHRPGHTHHRLERHATRRVQRGAGGHGGGGKHHFQRVGQPHRCGRLMHLCVLLLC